MEATAMLPGGEVRGRLVGFDPGRDMLVIEGAGEAPLATATAITVAGFEYSKGAGRFWTRLGDGVRTLAAGLNDNAMRSVLQRSLGQ